MTVHYLARLVPRHKQAGYVNLERDFHRAIETAKQLSIDHLGFAPRQQIGFAFIEYWGSEREFYEPNDDAPTAAVIVPVIDQGDLVDLAAVDLRSQHIARRLGDGHGLGLDAVEMARFGCCDLYLMERPLDWLRFPLSSSIKGRVRREPVYLFKLSTITVALGGVARIICPTIELTERAQAFLPPSQRNRVVVDHARKR